MAPQLRLVENDSSYVSLQDVYDEYSRSRDRTREDSIMFFSEKVKQLADPSMQKVSLSLGVRISTDCAE
jgi:transformation/transcription domain-associated protein